MDWDPRLDSLGIKYNSNPAATWALTSAVYKDEQEAQGRHHIYFTVTDENGRPVQNAACFMDWVNRDSQDQPTRALSDSGGQANTPMYAAFDTTLKNGAYSAYIQSPEASDSVSGMGLPEHHHVSFLLTFTRRGAARTSPATSTITVPEQPPEPAAPAASTSPAAPSASSATSPEPVTLGAQPTPADPHLASFPRPVGDNGRGLHFILDTRQAYVEAYAPYLATFQIKWATVYGGDESQCIRVAQYLKDNFGIYSNMRVEATGDAPKATSFWLTFAQKAVAAGVPPYIQIFNEPEDGREGFDTPEQFASLWIPRAQAVVDGGGFPGLQVLSSEYFDAVVRQVGGPIKTRLYFSLHNYGANHPPEYPYPAQTVMQDDTAVLRFIEYAQWFKNAWGWVPPMLGGEGGWLYRNQDDASMPPVEAPSWIAWHLEMFEWFRKGILSNGDTLPDYLFSVHPWLLWAANWYSDSWVDGFDADKKKPLLDSLKNAPPYVRQFYGGQPPAPPPPPAPGTLTGAIVAKAKSVTWMPVNNTAALWKYAKANGLQDQQTDEIEFTYNGQTYVCQVFNLGIVYCKKGDWGNITLIRK